MNSNNQMNEKIHVDGKEKLSALFIGGLTTDTRVNDIKKLLGPHIHTKSIYLPINKDTGKPKGFAFLNIPSKQVSLVLGRVYPYKGRMLRFELKSKDISDIKHQHRVFISNLPLNITDDQLRVAISIFGRVKYGYVIRKEGSGHFGFIEFEQDIGIQNALRNNGNHFIWDQWIKVEHYDSQRVKGTAQEDSERRFDLMHCLENNDIFSYGFEQSIQNSEFHNRSSLNNSHLLAANFNNYIIQNRPTNNSHYLRNQKEDTSLAHLQESVGGDPYSYTSTRAQRQYPQNGAPQAVGLLMSLFGIRSCKQGKLEAREELEKLSREGGLNSDISNYRLNQ